MSQTGSENLILCHMLYFVIYSCRKVVLTNQALRENCPNTDLFLVRIWKRVVNYNGELI